MGEGAVGAVDAEEGAGGRAPSVPETPQPLTAAAVPATATTNRRPLRSVPPMPSAAPPHPGRSPSVIAPTLA